MLFDLENIKRVQIKLFQLTNRRLLANEGNGLNCRKKGGQEDIQIHEMVAVRDKAQQSVTWSAECGRVLVSVHSIKRSRSQIK